MLKGGQLKKFLKALGVVATVSTLTLTAPTPAEAIVGGTPATQPNSVSLHSGAGFECGGVLIAPQWVLTAAHCLPYTTLNARIGSLSRTSGGELIGITERIANPAFNPTGNFGHDLGLVKLAKPSKQKPLPLWLEGAVGSTGTTQGWGLTCDDNLDPQGTAPCWGSSPVQLQQLNITRAQNSLCNLVRPSDNLQLNDPSLMCFTQTDRSRLAGICFGDSGSPTFRTVAGKQVVTGIVAGLMNNTSLRQDICSLGPNGEVNRDVATKASSGWKWIVATLLQRDPAAAQYVQSQANMTP
jgi:secreted trypsin-like serine protease